MTMTLIETKTLASTASFIEFTSIPQTFTDLLVLHAARDNRSDNYNGFNMLINGSTTGYVNRALFGTGTSTGSVLGGTTSAFGGRLNSATSTANTFANSLIYIPNYSGSTNKSLQVDGVSENNAATSFQEIWAVSWSNTAAITTLRFTPDADTTLQIGTTISLYGITKGSSGGVTVS